MDDLLILICCDRDELIYASELT